jgi:hypothetical protein
MIPSIRPGRWREPIERAVRKGDPLTGLRRLIDKVMAELVGPRGRETCLAASATSTLPKIRSSPANSIMCPQADTPACTTRPNIRLQPLPLCQHRENHLPNGRRPYKAAKNAKKTKNK